MDDVKKEFPSDSTDAQGKKDGKPVLLDGMNVIFHTKVALAPVTLREKTKIIRPADTVKAGNGDAIQNKTKKTNGSSKNKLN